MSDNYQNNESKKVLEIVAVGIQPDEKGKLQYNGQSAVLTIDDTKASIICQVYSLPNDKDECKKFLKEQGLSQVEIDEYMSRKAKRIPTQSMPKDSKDLDK